MAEQNHPLEQQPIFDGLSAHEAQLACAAFTIRHNPQATVIFQQGDHAEEMFIIARGRASVYVPDSEGGSTRLMTFAPGTLFGEIAILDRQPRSATVIADGELHCHVLAESAFEALKL